MHLRGAHSTNVLSVENEVNKSFSEKPNFYQKNYKILFLMVVFFQFVKFFLDIFEFSGKPPK